MTQSSPPRLNFPSAPVAARMLLGFPWDATYCVSAFAFSALILGWWPCSYTLDPQHLIIHWGVLFRSRIAYADIDDLQVCIGFAPAPALSHRRIRIGCGRRIEWVSPRARPAFLAALRERLALARNLARSESIHG